MNPSSYNRSSLRRALAAALLGALLGGCSGGDKPASTGGNGGSGGSTATSSGSGGSSADSSSASSGAGGGGPAGWKLVWSDEFDGPDGSPVDGTKWTALVGGDGWGNQEREYYTDSTTNAHIEGGALVITATQEGANQHQCWYGTCEYTSARLQTKGKLEQAYGRFEARIRIPRGQGIWPAFWMLGGDIDNAGWPGCGEIDIMENVGKEPGTVHGSMHGPGYSGGNPLTASYELPGGGAFADADHVFAVEWEPDTVRFYVDDALYETRTPADIPGGTKWVYDHPFFLLLNVAVGGNWPGSPDNTTIFPQTMRVDYVRVYQKP
jgi:beta-glucanase (GH16 family)